MTNTQPKNVQETTLAGITQAPAGTASTGPALAANLVLLSFSIHRPTMRKQIKDADITIKTEDGDESVSIKDAKKLTTPQIKLDLHEGWAKLDATARELESILDRYSVSDVRRGNRLISGGSIGECLAELAAARNKRRTVLMEQLYDKWDTEVVPGIIDAHNKYQKQAVDGLIERNELQAACDVEWQIQPLTPISPEQLDLTKLNQEDRLRVIEQSNEMIEKAAKTQVQMVLDKVAGELVELCQGINEGGLKSGKRKSGALTEILNMLERVTHFSDFVTPEILQQAKAAHKIVKQYNINQLNSMEDVQEAIANAMLPLGDSLKKLQDDYVEGRAVRQMRV